VKLAVFVVKELLSVAKLLLSVAESIVFVPLTGPSYALAPAVTFKLRQAALAPAADKEPVASAGGLAPLITSHSMIATSPKKAG
jgi:hypothetical protein